MKKVLITGAAGGIGKAMVRHFLQNGWYVFGTDLSCEALEEFSGHSSFKSIQIDVTSDVSIANSLSQINALTTSMHGLINNAGMFDHFPLAEGKAGQFEKILSVNVLGAARMTRAFFPLLLKSNGRVVNISSETAMVSLPMQVYGVSKRMLEVYTDALRQELDLLGVKVILIRPGAHATELFAQSREILGRIEEGSAFGSALHVVKDKGRDIIDQGAADPAEIPRVVYHALTDRNPRRVYHVNVARRFLILQRLPRVIKEHLLHRLLQTKA